MISTSLRIDVRHQLPSAKLGLAGVHLKLTSGLGPGPVPAFPPVPGGVTVTVPPGGSIQVGPCIPSAVRAWATGRAPMASCQPRT
jgi:hypothetical protein